MCLVSSWASGAWTPATRLTGLCLIPLYLFMSSGMLTVCRVVLCSGIRTPDLVSVGVGKGTRLEPGQESQLQEAVVAAAAAAAGVGAASGEEGKRQQGTSIGAAGDSSVDRTAGGAADSGTESSGSGSEATVGALYRLAIG